MTSTPAGIQFPNGSLPQRMLILWQCHFTVHCLWMSKFRKFSFPKSRNRLLLFSLPALLSIDMWRECGDIHFYSGQCRTQCNAFYVKTVHGFLCLFVKSDVQSLLFVTLMDIVIPRIYTITTLCVLTTNVGFSTRSILTQSRFCIIKIQWGSVSTVNDINSQKKEKKVYTYEFYVDESNFPIPLKRLLVEFVASDKPDGTP